MIETGLAIFGGLALIFLKLKRRTMLRLLSHTLAIDITVTLVTLVIHWGTFSGVMAATFAGLLTSVGTSLAKRTFGYIARGQYFPGLVRLEV